MTEPDLREAARDLTIGEFPHVGIERRAAVIRRRRTAGRAALALAAVSAVGAPIALRHDGSASLAVGGPSSETSVLAAPGTSTSGEAPSIDGGPTVLPARVPTGFDVVGATGTALLVAQDDEVRMVPLDGSSTSPLPNLRNVVAISRTEPSVVAGYGKGDGTIEVVGLDGTATGLSMGVSGPRAAEFAGDELLVIDAKEVQVLDVRTGTHQAFPLPPSVPSTAKVRGVSSSASGISAVLWEDEAAALLDGRPMYLLKEWSNATRTFSDVDLPVGVERGGVGVAATIDGLLLLHERDGFDDSSRWRETWIYQRIGRGEWTGTPIGDRHFTCPVGLATSERVTVVASCRRAHVLRGAEWRADPEEHELLDVVPSGDSVVATLADGTVLRWS